MIQIASASSKKPHKRTNEFD